VEVRRNAGGGRFSLPKMGNGGTRKGERILAKKEAKGRRHLAGRGETQVGSWRQLSEFKTYKRRSTDWGRTSRSRSADAEEKEQNGKEGDIFKRKTLRR